MRGNEPFGDIGQMLRSYLEGLSSEIAVEEVLARPKGSPSSRRVIVTGVVLTLVVSAVVVTPLLRDIPRASAGVSISKAAGQVTVRLNSVPLDASEIRDALSEAGVPVSVVEVPVSPSRVGMFVGHEVRGGDVELVPLEGEDRAFTAFRFVEQPGARVTLYLGRPARVGELYQAGGSAFSPGESLACSGVWGQLVADAIPRLEELLSDYAVRWQILDSGGARMIDADPADIGHYYVSDALAVAPTEVVMYAATLPGSLFGADPPDERECDQ